MGRGMAVAFAFSGHSVRLIDAKKRDAAAFSALRSSAQTELRDTIHMMAKIGLVGTEEIDRRNRRPRQELDGRARLRGGARENAGHRAHSFYKLFVH